MSGMATNSGRFIDFDKLDPASFVIEDIAHSLSHQCRWAGHCNHHYSVAQHLVACSLQASDEAATYRESLVHGFDALMHDAAEAYVQDISRGLKHLPELDGYRDVENRMLEVLALKYGFNPVKAPWLALIDDRMARTEARDLFPQALKVMSREFNDLQPYRGVIVRWFPNEAKESFLSRFRNLNNAAKKEGLLL